MVYESILVLDDIKHQTISNSTRQLGKISLLSWIADPTLQIHTISNLSRHFLTLFTSNRCFIKIHNDVLIDEETNNVDGNVELSTSHLKRTF
ncbi:hypothetical protein Hanom_Chr12g01091211 [Helianthus anomalus]